MAMNLDKPARRVAAWLWITVVTVVSFVGVTCAEWQPDAVGDDGAAAGASAQEPSGSYTFGA